MDFTNRKDFLVGRLPFNDDRDSLDSCSLDSYMDSDASSLGHSPSFHESGRLIPESAYTELTDSTLTLTPQSARWRPPLASRQPVHHRCTITPVSIMVNTAEM